MLAKDIYVISISQYSSIKNCKTLELYIFHFLHTELQMCVDCIGRNRLLQFPGGCRVMAAVEMSRYYMPNFWCLKRAVDIL